MARQFNLSTLFGGEKKLAPLTQGKPDFFTENIKNDGALRKAAQNVTFVKGAGYNTLITDSFNIPIGMDETKSAHTRLKLLRAGDTQAWEIIRIRHFDLGADDQTGLDGNLVEEGLGIAPCLYDALHICAGFEHNHAPFRDSAKGKDYEGIRHWRKAAADAGQVVDMDGVLGLCADGKVLTKIGPYSRDQEKILGLTRKPDPVESGIFEKLFSESSSPSQTQTHTWQPPQRAPEKHYVDQDPTAAALRAWLETKEQHGDNDERTRAAKEQYDKLKSKIPPAQGLVESQDVGSALLTWGMLSVPALALFLAFLPPVAPNQAPPTEDIIRASNSDTESARTFINVGANISIMAIQDRGGDTALMEAVNRGLTETVQALINAGANMDIQGRGGWTALMFAAKKGDTETVQALINAGANVNLQNNYDWTALMFAAWWGHTETARTLINAGINVNVQDTDGETALMFAAKNGHTEIVQALINAGANVNLQNNSGGTALKLATDNGNTQIVQMLHAAMNQEKPVSSTSLAKAFTVTGDTCEMRGNTISVNAGADASKIPLPKGCSLIPR